MIADEPVVREVAVDLRRGWNIGETLAGLAVAPAVIADREKRLVLDDRTTEDAAELVLVKWSRTVACQISEGIPGVKRIVSHVFEPAAVETVASRFRDHVDDAAGRTAIVSLGIVTDDLEFLNEVDVRNHDVRRASNIGVYDSVVIVELRAVLLPVEGGVRKA